MGGGGGGSGVFIFYGRVIGFVYISIVYFEEGVTCRVNLGPIHRGVLLKAVYIKQGTQSNCIFKFPVFSLCFSCPTAHFPCATLHNL